MTLQVAKDSSTCVIQIVDSASTALSSSISNVMGGGFGVINSDSVYHRVIVESLSIEISRTGQILI